MRYPPFSTWLSAGLVLVLVLVGGSTWAQGEAPSVRRRPRAFRSPESARSRGVPIAFGSTSICKARPRSPTTRW